MCFLPALQVKPFRITHSRTTLPDMLNKLCQVSRWASCLLWKVVEFQQAGSVGAQACLVGPSAWMLSFVPSCGPLVQGEVGWT